MQIEKIYLVPHFHFDFEWWKEEPHHERDTLVILDKALNMLDRYPDFTYVIDTVLPLKMYINEREEGFDRIKRFIDQGRVEIVGGGIVSPDEVMPLSEALVRQFEEGQAWLKKVFGIQARVAWEIDQFAHPERMPQVLAPLGFKYFVFARGVSPFDSMHPTLFNWHDPSGKSRLTAYWWAAHYEGSLVDKIKNERVKKRYIKRFFREMKSRLEFEGRRSPVPWLMVPLGGDFTVPSDAWMDFVRLWNHQKEVKLEFTLPTKYFQLVEQFEIPDYTGSFPPVFDGYFTSREKGKQAARKSTNALIELDKLISLAAIHGYNNPEEQLKKAWWNVLKGDFHDTIAGTGTDRVYRQSMSRYEQAGKLIHEEKKNVYGFLEGVVKGRGPFVFNSLNWDRVGLIRNQEEEMLIQTKAMSFAPVEKKLSSDPVKVNETSIENRYLKIGIDTETGDLSVFDKVHNFYPLPEACNKTFIIDDVGNLWVTRSLGIKYPLHFIEFAIRQESTNSAVISLREENRFVKIHKEVGLQTNSRQISFRTALEFTGKDKRIDIGFPFSFEGAWHTENVFQAKKAAPGIHPVQNFALFRGENYGVALINKGIPGYLLEKKAGKLMLLRSVSMFSWLYAGWILKNIPLIFRSLSKAYPFMKKKLNLLEFPIYPIHNMFLRTFATEGNLQGHGAMNKKNHRRAILRFHKESLAWERGKHHFEYALHMDVQSIGQAVRKALEFNHPLQPFHFEGTGQEERIDLLAKEVPGIVISSVRKQQEHIILRAYEPMGVKVQTELEFSFPVKKVLRYSGSAEHPEEVNSHGNKVKDLFEPFEMIRYEVEQAPE